MKTIIFSLALNKLGVETKKGVIIMFNGNSHYLKDSWNIIYPIEYHFEK